MITLSIVSHRQGELVQSLLGDIECFDSPLIDRILITLNVPEAWRPISTTLRNKITVLPNNVPRGFGANHNAAFEACSSEYFAVLNPDLHLPDDPFSELLCAIEADPRLGLVAPTILGPHGIPEDSVRPLVTPWEVVARKVGVASFDQSRNEPAWLAGMFMLFRSEAFRSLGGFDTRYFMYCEDFDICARVRLVGLKFRSVDSIAVVHHARRSTLKSSRHLLWHLSSLAKMWSSRAFWRYRRLLKNSG